MQAQAFLHKARCTCQGLNTCTCPHNELAAEAFQDNVKDIAATLVKVMIVCGINKCNAAQTPKVVTYAFLYYDELLKGMEEVPNKRLCREDLMYKFSTDCNMTLSESHLSYAIVKRAFKAFFYGTTQGSVRNTLLEAKLIHTQECMWVHAAKKTAEVFSEYEGMFFNAYNKYERHIMSLYKHLFERIKRRAESIDGDVCKCEDCFDTTDINYNIHLDTLKNVYPKSKACGQLICNPEDTKIADKEDNICIEDEPELKSTDSNETVKLPRCKKCTCPKLICECDVDPITGVQNVNCGQGPFQCTWFRVKNKPIDLSKRLDKPEHYQCLVDCRADTSLSCDSVCQCDCEVCTCEVEPTTSSESTFGEEEYEQETSEYMGSFELESDSTVSVKDLPHRKIYGGCRVGPPDIDESNSDDYEYDEYGRKREIDFDSIVYRGSRASMHSRRDTDDSVERIARSIQLNDIVQIKEGLNVDRSAYRGSGASMYSRSDIVDSVGKIAKSTRDLVAKSTRDLVDVVGRNAKSTRDLVDSAGRNAKSTRDLGAKSTRDLGAKSTRDLVDAVGRNAKSTRDLVDSTGKLHSFHDSIQSDDIDEIKKRQDFFMSIWDDKYLETK